MKEAVLFIGYDGNPIAQHTPLDRTMVRIPESDELWDIWYQNRDHILGQAHSHPGSGKPSPSWEDITTFSAIERGLAKRFVWWICSADTTLEVRWMGPDKYDYRGKVVNNFDWFNLIQRLSLRSP